MVTFIVRLHPPEQPLTGWDGSVRGVVEEVATGRATTVRCGAELLTALVAALSAAAVPVRSVGSEEGT